MKRLLIFAGGLACLLFASVAYAATINGTRGSDTLIGTTRADTIDARAGVLDTVLGLSGDDNIKGGPGPDSIQGDGSCPPRTRNIELCDQNAGSGNDDIRGDSGEDVIVGGRGSDEISGGGDSDNIDGGRGTDTIDGGIGADTLYGGPANDTVRGGRGGDMINAGPGRDRIYGDAGNDTIDANDGQRDSVACGSGTDLVHTDGYDSIARNCERASRASP